MEIVMFGFYVKFRVCGRVYFSFFTFSSIGILTKGAIVVALLVTNSSPLKSGRASKGKSPKQPIFRVLVLVLGSAVFFF